MPSVCDAWAGNTDWGNPWGFLVCPSSLVHKLQVPERDSILKSKRDCHGHLHGNVRFCCCSFNVKRSPQVQVSEHLVPARRCLGDTAEPFGTEALLKEVSDPYMDPWGNMAPGCFSSQPAFCLYLTQRTEVF